MTAPVRAYKAFDPCMRGLLRYQFEVGRTYVHNGPVKVCHSGFHACTRPLDVLHYYWAYSRFALVEASGKMEVSEGDGSSKFACERITILRELTLSELIDADTEQASTAGPLLTWGGCFQPQRLTSK